MSKRCIKIIEENKDSLPWLHRRRNDSTWMMMASSHLSRCLKDIVYPDQATMAQKRKIRSSFCLNALRYYNDTMQDYKGRS